MKDQSIIARPGTHRRQPLGSCGFDVLSIGLSHLTKVGQELRCDSPIYGPEAVVCLSHVIEVVGVTGIPPLNRLITALKRTTPLHRVVRFFISDRVSSDRQNIQKNHHGL